jgi:cytochrome c oxidase subunit 2
MRFFFHMPPAASEFASQVDVLLWTMTAVTGAVAGAIFVLLIWFSIRYRRAAAVDRTLGDGARARKRNHILEAVWITVPLVIFLAFYVWAAWLFFRYQSPLRAPLEVYVVAKQWMWKLEQPGGQREINELHVPIGRAVRLVMTSQDVIHSFYVPALRIKHDVVPGRYEELWFKATRTGTYHLFCSEYCGTDHARMGGRVFVMEPEAYAQWLAHAGPQVSLAVQGQRRFIQFGCSGCHDRQATVHAPPLENLFGQTIPLADGRFVRVDERYVRDSILLPGTDIAAGYQNLMPSYTGRLAEEDILALVEYIKSLAPASTPAAEERP